MVVYTLVVFFGVLLCWNCVYMPTVLATIAKEQLAIWGVIGPAFSLRLFCLQTCTVNVVCW